MRYVVCDEQAHWRSCVAATHDRRFARSIGGRRLTWLNESKSPGREVKPNFACKKPVAIGVLYLRRGIRRDT